MKLKQYYKLHCKILTNMIKEAKRSNYTEPIVHSHNKVKTWNITKSETRKKSQ
jgi:hypothetical protein